MTKSDYKNWSKTDLVKEIERLKKRKKYGLVWEDKPEDVVERCKRELPILEEVKDKEIMTDTDQPTNLLIEGDNYHTLSVLNYTHKGKIDVIYIDPPYNTGAKDWKYNNHYVDSNDAYRHSKWISFMYHRLVLAKKLLSDKGILITAIDDNEFATLRLLLDELFSKYTHETVVVNHHPQGSGGANVSITHEYAIVSVPKGKHLFLGEFVGSHIEEWALIKYGAGEDYYREGRPRMFFAIHVDKESGNAVDVGPELSLDEKYPTEETENGLKRVYPLDSEGNERRWRYGRETMIDLVSKGKIKASLPSFSMKVLVDREGSYKPVYSNWTDSKYNAGPHGTRLLKQIIPDTNFPFPKSIHTTQDFIASSTRLNKNATVLDFFAGSGTTGQAVMELNQQDDGSRKFILATNNENGIATDVCYPRIKKVIEGYKNGKEKIEGLGSNLKYFRTSFVPAEPTDKNKTELTKKATEMLCIREDTFEQVKAGEEFKIFKGEDHHTGIIFDQLAIPDFKKEIAKIGSKFSVYVFSLGDDTFEDEFADMRDKVALSPIPEAILRVYRRIFK